MNSSLDCITTLTKSSTNRLHSMLLQCGHGPIVCIVFMRMRTKPHPHPVISEATPTSSYKKGPEVLAVFALACTFPAFS